jgi:hypothetical protein
LVVPEGAVRNVDVDGERLATLVVKDRAERSKNSFESLNTFAEVVSLLAALEEGLLDLSVFL